MYSFINLLSLVSQVFNTTWNYCPTPFATNPKALQRKSDIMSDEGPCPSAPKATKAEYAESSWMTAENPVTPNTTPQALNVQP